MLDKPQTQMDDDFTSVWKNENSFVHYEIFTITLRHWKQFGKHSKAKLHIPSNILQWPNNKKYRLRWKLQTFTWDSFPNLKCKNRSLFTIISARNTGNTIDVIARPNAASYFLSIVFKLSTSSDNIDNTHDLQNQDAMSILLQ